jgi:hypothetical protein
MELAIRLFAIDSGMTPKSRIALNLFCPLAISYFTYNLLENIGMLTHVFQVNTKDLST